MKRLRLPFAVVVTLLAALGGKGVWCAAPVRDVVPHLRVARPTPVHTLPIARSRVLFVLTPGQEVRILAGALQIGAALATPAAPREGSGLYDPNLSADVVDRVSEGYTVVFHEIGGAAGAGGTAGSAGTSGPRAPASAPVAATGLPLATDCGAPPTDGCAPPALREPDNSGTWIQILSPDATTRGWVLVPARAAVAGPAVRGHR